MSLEDILKRIEEDDRMWADLSEEEINTIERRYIRSILQVIRMQPFLGYIAAKISDKRIWIKTPDQLKGGMKFRTMAVDGKHLYIWPQFILYNDEAMIASVLLHEMLHLVFYHLERAFGYEPELANAAMDYAVNMTINDIGSELKTERNEARQDGRPWFHIPSPPYLVDERFRDPKSGYSLGWEKIYRELLKEQSENGNQGNRLKGQMVDSHGPWGKNNRPSDEDGNTNTDQISKREVTDMIHDAAVYAEGSKVQGAIPGALSRMIEEITNPPLPWQRLLQNYLRPVDGLWDYTPGDVRMEDPLPWVVPDYKIRYILISVDTSGSMSDQEVAAAVNECRAILAGFPQTKGILCQCDATVDYWEDIKEVEKPFQRHGYGGTTFEPPFQRAIDEGIADDIDLHIYFTDGYGRFPNEDWLQQNNIKFDTLWVITNDQITPPDNPQYKWTRLKSAE